MKFGNVKLPNTIWMCENEQARWFEFEEPHDLPDDVTVTKMVPEQEQRTWVGLTKEDKWEIVQATERDDRGHVMALVEAKLKEKNTSPVVHIFTTPPPRQPLTDEEIRKWWASENGLEDCHMSKLDDFSKVVRAIEAAHGIKEKNT